MQFVFAGRRGVKKGFSKKICSFGFVILLCWRKKWKGWKNGKGTFQQKTVFLGGCEQERFFLLKWHFLKIGNTICMRMEKTRIFVDTSLFLWPYKITKHYKHRGFSRHRGKPKMALLVSKVPFWEWAWKGGFTICDTQKLCSALRFVIHKSCALL